MAVLNDGKITKLSTDGFITFAFPPTVWVGSEPTDERKRMIDPFAEGKKRPGKISYGVSSYGYDFRIGEEFKIFRAPACRPDFRPLTSFLGSKGLPPHYIDPKDFGDDICEDAELHEDKTGKFILLPPHSFCLGVTVERFCIPRDIITLCVGKSTYARTGIYINVTPFEPEWEGHATVEILNPTQLPAKIYANEGIGQLLFLTAEERHWGHYSYERLVCDVSYADKQGKYQSQGPAVVPPRVDKENS